MRRSRSRKRNASGITVQIQRLGGALVGFDVRGHAGFGSAGTDVVCAGVSALVLSTSHGLRRHCRQRISVVDHENAYSLRLMGKRNVCSQALLRTLLSGLEAIARSYPGYMRITTKRQLSRKH